MTPRKLQALLKVHMYLKQQEIGVGSNKNKASTPGFIDNIPGW